MSKKKKVLLIIAGVLLLIGIAFAILIINLGKRLNAYIKFDYDTLDMSTVEDGTYVGSEDGSIVKATVEVTVKDHTITNVTILSHQNGMGQPAEVIVDDILANNTPDVDAISGATYSSNVIKKAVYNALTLK